MLRWGNGQPWNKQLSWGKGLPWNKELPWGKELPSRYTTRGDTTSEDSTRDITRDDTTVRRRNYALHLALWALEAYNWHS